MHPRSNRPWGFGVLWLVSAGCAADRQERAPAVPQRPTVASDTGTTHVGTFELESGGSYDPGESFDSPMTLKYGLDRTTELFSGWSPIQWADLPGSDGVGVGDLTIGFRHRYLEDEGLRPSAAVQITGQFGTADPDEGVGTGQPGLLAAAIATKNIDNVATTLFYQLAVLGKDGSGGVDVQHTVTGVVSVALGGPWSAFGEVAGIFSAEGGDSPVFTTLGVAQAVEPWLVLDASVNVGLDSAADDLLLQLGFTMNFGGVTAEVPRR